MLFYFGLTILIIVSLVEFNPLRYRGAFRHSKSDNLSGIFMTTSSAFVGLASVIDKIWHFMPLPTKWSPMLETGAITLITAAFFVRNTALHVLGKNFNYAVAPLQDGLRTAGVYRYIRHPAYLGTSLYAIATPLLFSSGLGLCITFFTIISVLYRIHIEETFLEKTAGNEYTEYKKKTWRMVPFIY